MKVTEEMRGVSRIDPCSMTKNITIELYETKNCTIGRRYSLAIRARFLRILLSYHREGTRSPSNLQEHFIPFLETCIGLQFAFWSIKSTIDYLRKRYHDVTMMTHRAL